MDVAAPLRQAVQPPPRRATAWGRRARLRPWPLAVAVPLAVQLVVLLVRAQQQWDHYNLALDYSIFHQAWHQIGAGDLSPTISVFGYPYWRSHFELLMWALAPFRLVFRSGAFLLYAQAVATVAAEAVALWWAAEMLERRFPGRQAEVAVVAGGMAVLGALNPWVYVACAQDVHLEAFGVLFAALAGRDFWRGRRGRGWVWVALCLATGDVAGTYVAGLGLSVVLAAGRRHWRLGLGLLAAGAGWIAAVSALDAGRGSGVESYAWVYGGLDGGPGASAFGVLAGLASHPGQVLSVLADRWEPLFRNLIPVGVVGAVAPWMAGTVVLVLLENGLHFNPFFSGPAFQNTPVYVFGLAGTALVLGGLALRLPRRAGLPAAMALVVAVAVPAVDLAITRTEAVNPFRVDRATADELAVVAARVPGGAEVVSSFGVAGRFAGRRHLYLFDAPGKAVPVERRQVAFVLAPGAGNQPLAPPEMEAVARAVRDRLRATVLADGPRVYAYLWSPPPERLGRPLVLTGDLQP